MTLLNKGFSLQNTQNTRKLQCRFWAPNWSLPPAIFACSAGDLVVRGGLSHDTSTGFRRGQLCIALSHRAAMGYNVGRTVGITVSSKQSPSLVEVLQC
ncbi:MAG: hypothetical protein AUJ92_13340 [Armatimonadetes bacterium CG2_30_59_28]|nr:MAG: hypothetical protein AUJ92_13340 [Armatimonadetes bacterium CG2_30_59_28]PIU66815.1 MAG: hypothetical protein COS85_03205 [Armatimonadetes bacterium CG07_land_8_20_14_0_80_59_28]PIX43909.1 MAG: hypothetical protein COZ56_06005 [Armatimonadetes bacterium CG_4_8_14_3_um_filter_58_9]PIY49235.1 MAG: hypothetical protein COZ05_00845 [Armatimonadetes bacterium CG_4_10_14_3_um_filter_59_10]